MERLPSSLFIFALCGAVVALAASVSAEFMMPRDSWPQIVAHRGASGYLPEHSLNGYQLAIDLGTDYVEPDLCLSKDAVFVCIHDTTLDATTDIIDHPEYADRKKEDGSFYVADFTLAELKTLRLKQRSSSRTDLYNGLLTIPTFQELTDLMWQNYAATGRMVGIYPELKEPFYHDSLGFNFSMAEMLIQQLEIAGYQTKGCTNNMTQVNPVAIQCFEGETLRKLKDMTDIPLLQLVTDEILFTEDSLSAVAQYAQAVGPKKDFLEQNYADLQTARDKVQMAHSLGLVLHPWTVKQDSVPTDLFDSAAAEAAYLYCCLQVDGIFAEFPDRMRETLDEMQLDAAATCQLGGC